MSRVDSLGGILPGIGSHLGLREGAVETKDPVAAKLLGLTISLYEFVLHETVVTDACFGTTSL